MTERQRAIPEQSVRHATSPHRLVNRSNTHPQGRQQETDQEIADVLEIKVRTPRLWRRRWAEASAQLTEAEGEATEAQLAELIAVVLADQPRSGAPPTSTPEQICRIFALACEDPLLSGCPATEWTPTELADEAVQRGIVSTISPRSVGRSLYGR